MTGAGALPFPAEELLRATKVEIAAILDDGSSSAEKVTLRDGSRVGPDEYVFSDAKWNDALSAGNLLIRAGRSGKWTRATVSRDPDGRHIRVTTDAPLGQKVPTATIIPDETTGHEVLMERLRHAAENNGSFSTSSAGWLFGLGRPQIALCPDPGRFVNGYHGRQLNARQRRAIEHALASEVTFVWGPPGTGKTDVVASIVEGCYRQGLRTLFVAPTHIAVDQALERICDLLCGEEQFEDGLVQRKGAIAAPALDRRYGDRIVAERIADRAASNLDEQIVQAKAQLHAVESDIRQYDEASELSAELSRIGAQLSEIDRQVVAFDTELEAATKSVAQLRQQIDEIGSPSGLFAQRKQAKLDDLRRRKFRVEQDAEGVRQQRAAAKAPKPGLLADSAAVAGRLERASAALIGKSPADQLRPLRDRIREHHGQLQEQRQKLADYVRSQCRVMGTTVAKAVQSRTLMDSIDVVVIDEAGMVDLPSAWLAAGLARKRVVVAGDFRQLSAVTRGSSNRNAPAEDREHSRIWMDRDAFRAAGLVTTHGSVRTDDPRMIALNEQYRMRPAICAVVNRVAYEDAPLSTGRSNVSSLAASPLLELPLVLIDTSHRTIESGGNQAHLTNPVHEAAIHEFIRGLQYDTVLPARKATDPADGHRPTDLLAVIVPYNNQKRTLAASLKYRFGESYDALVDTVHRFQGSQRPLVVIDTVAGAGEKLGNFYEGVNLDSSTCRLLNVALSRAQDQLAVVANVSFLRAKLRQGPVIRMLDHLEQHAQRLSIDELIPIRAASDLAAMDQEQLARPAFFPADEVHRAVEWDIAKARRSIDIYCAFLNRGPVARWLRTLSEPISRGIRVVVHTRPPEPDSKEVALVEKLRTSGCQINYRERMHEKVMIVDDSVLWHGSLNLLANIGPTDLMMRITDPTSCERVKRIVDQAKMERPARPPYGRTATGGAINGEIKVGDVRDGRRYLNVPREEKDEAKRAVKAHWNPTLKLWHVAADIPLDQLSRWLPQAGDDR
ncbi:AAA domain-containing protein [Nocardia sp. NBC_01327]|uniref:AAA domain-containing protein n=1 Tax=Nocardia sp. NBC_01327 TaxID=2903593 RepID=UPI002E11F179|nr:AAA domain-containing protein [Nocardia sp. NBC_01327]